MILRQRLGQGPCNYIFENQSRKDSGMFMTRVVVTLSKRDLHGGAVFNIVRVPQSKQGWKEALEALKNLVSTTESEDWVEEEVARVLQDLHIGNGKLPS
jgi:hypothetical protein